MELPPQGVLAMAVFDLARQGILARIPSVKVDPQGMNLENETDYGVFRRQNVLILDAKETPDGTYSQTMVVESVDPLGRIDLSRDHVAYRLREATEAEIADIKRGYTEKAQEVKGLDQELSRDFQEAVVAYQQAAGLEAERREIIFTLQEILAADLPYLPIYSLEVIEAQANRFTGWVDQLGGIGNYWSFVLVKPTR